MFKFNYMLCLEVLINLFLIQYTCGQFETTFTSCNDFKLSNGRVRFKPKGHLAKFECNRGYTLAGEKYSYCISGKFSVAPPVCVKATCTEINQLTNGVISPTYNGGVVNFNCKPGFTMRGLNVSYCNGSSWSHNPPTCINTQTPQSCDFESKDLCGWSYDLNWRRKNFQTPNGHVDSGPRHDHTKGVNQDGYYMYIESTSRLESNISRLISPLYPRQPNGLCVTFWYHMFGQNIGTLIVFLQEGTTSWGKKPLWVEHGNQGDVWHQARIALDGVQEDFQVSFEGVRGIAVDDVTMSETCLNYRDFKSSKTTKLSVDNYSNTPPSNIH